MVGNNNMLKEHLRLTRVLVKLPARKDIKRMLLHASPFAYNVAKRIRSAILYPYVLLRKFQPGQRFRLRRFACTMKSRKAFMPRMPGTGCRMMVNENSFAKYWYINGMQEKGALPFLQRFLKPGMICIDAGANAGFYALFMAKLVSNKGKVYAFEPCLSTNTVLLQNISINKLNNVTVEKSALGNCPGFADFWEGPPGFEVFNTLGEVSHPSAINKAFKVTRVPITSLNQYAIDKDLNRIDFIKIDVEGAELQVLQGMDDLVRREKVNTMLIEFADQTTAGFGYRAEEIGKWLLSRGFSLFGLDEKGHPVQFECEGSHNGEMVLALK